MERRGHRGSRSTCLPLPAAPFARAATRVQARLILQTLHLMSKRVHLGSSRQAKHRGTTLDLPTLFQKQRGRDVDQFGLSTAEIVGMHRRGIGLFGAFDPTAVQLGEGSK